MVTIIEGISAEGKCIPPAIIIEDSWFIEDWENENQVGSEFLFLSNSGYSNEDLGLKWLDYFIFYLGIRPKAPYKMFLFDGYSSYITEDFRIRYWDNYIVPYEFPSHITYLI